MTLGPRDQSGNCGLPGNDGEHGATGIPGPPDLPATLESGQTGLCELLSYKFVYNMLFVKFLINGTSM